MKLIRTAFLLSTGFSIGTVYTLRHSDEIVGAIEDLRDAVIDAFSEKEDPEKFARLLEHFADKDDDELLWGFGDMDSEFEFTVGDLRALSVHYEPTEVLDGLPEYTYPTKIILEKLDAYAKEHGIDDAGMIEFIDKITNDETPKEPTTP